MGLKLNKDKVFDLLILSGIVLASFIFLLYSPDHPWRNEPMVTDSSVFKTVAKMTLNGYIPYKDSFDHKGPLTYVLNIIGNLISETSGIVYIELVFLALTLFILYKEANLFVSKIISLLIVLFSSSIIFTYFNGGGYVEEYAIFFISLSIYIFTDYFINNKISKLRLILCGFSFGCVLMLRPNMIALWVVMCLNVLYKSIRDKEIKNLGNFTLWFIVGVLVIVIPLLVWLGINGALNPFLECYIKFNFTYSTTDYSNFFHFYNALYYYGAEPVVFTGVITMVIICIIKKRQFDFAYLEFMILAIILIALPGFIHLYYGILLIPLSVYPYAYVLKELIDNTNRKTSIICIIVIFVYLLRTIYMNTWLPLIRQVPDYYSEKDETHYTQTIYSIVDVISKKTNEDDKISVFGNWDSIYIYSNRLHATRFSYTTVCYVDTSLKEEYFKELEEEMPKIIVVQNDMYNDDIKKFLDENNYELIWSENEGTLDGSLVFGVKNNE